MKLGKEIGHVSVKSRGMKRGNALETVVNARGQSITKPADEKGNKRPGNLLNASNARRCGHSNHNCVPGASSAQISSRLNLAGSLAFSSRHRVQ